MQNRNLALCIVLSIVTCGIYGIYWFYQIAEDFDRMPTQNRVSTTPAVTTVLYIVTCGIYGMYAFYIWGKASAEIAAMHGQPAEDRSIMFLILAIFGLIIVDMALIQNDFNNYTMPPQNPGQPPQDPGQPPYTPPTYAPPQQ